MLAAPETLNRGMVLKLKVYRKTVFSHAHTWLLPPLYSTRMLALEFLLQLFENAGGMVRKEIGIVDTFIKLAVSLVCEVEDDPDWEKQLESPRFYSGDDESQLVSFGEEAVDRIARHMGSQIVVSGNGG